MPAFKKHHLHRLVKAGDLAAIQALPVLSSGEVNQFDAYKYTPLMYAASARYGGVAIARELLRRGAWINIAEQNLLAIALAGGDPAMVPALLAAGLDLRTTAANGSDALIKAVHGRDVLRDPQLLDSIKLLISHGAPLNGVSEYGESALRVLSNIGRFDAVRLLLAAGADASHLQWTPLMEAVACGSLSDVKRLVGGSVLEARDWWQRTAWLLAIKTGDIAKAEVLRGAGVDIRARGRCNKPPLFYAIESDQPRMLEWLLDQGMSIHDTDEFATPALTNAVEYAAHDCIEVLLRAGADVDRGHSGGTALQCASSAKIAARLLDAGADPGHLSDESRRAFLGLEPQSDIYLLTASHQEFSRARTRRFGVANPEPIREEFWRSMIRAGVSAYAAAGHFGATSSSKQRPIWCARRFGQSLTFLADGRIVQIGGEHEDYYDDDFCIYNDVFVHEPGGEIRIFGYPEALFPPTDFHTATLLGDSIYIVGGLGYPESRRFGETPLFRLHLDDFHIERLEAKGHPPGWIHRHRARLMGPHLIRITNGTVATLSGEEEQHSPNDRSFVLDTRSLTWSS